MSGEARKRTGAWRSLGLVLWLVFSAFALVVIGVCILLQNILVGRDYRNQAYNTLKEAQNRIAERTESAALTGGDITAVAYEFGLGAYLVYVEDGSETSVVTFGGTERTYEELAEICYRLEGGAQEQFFSGEGEIACVSSVDYGGRTAWLCFFFSLGPIEAYEAPFRTISVITGLVAIVLAFAASGLFASFLAKPITEVTERAKALARGNYAPARKRKYFFFEIEELSDALEAARSEISVADSLQKELIANVSHDFKTPLTMIKAYASMIKDISGEDKAKRDAHAQIILDESDRLAALVTDVLDLSRLRAGAGGENPTVFNLSDAVYAIAGRFDYLRESQNYRIESEIAEELYTYADRARIEQVVYNLISNAVNYTGEDKRVRVKLFPKGEAARLEVIDSGKGIPPEEIDTIWDRYYRSPATHKRPVQGTGLGLSIVKGILLAQNIPFGVVSEVGKGSCFWVEFPAPPSDKEER